MPADKFVYEPLSGVCIPVDGPHTPHPIFAQPIVFLIVFDIAIIILTAFKTSRLAAALQGLPGAKIVHSFLSFPLCALLTLLLGSSVSCSGMGLCGYSRERMGTMPLTINHTSRYFIIIVSSSNGTIYILRSRDMQQVAIRIWNTIIWFALPKSFMYLGVYSYWAMLSTYSISLLSMTLG